MEKSSDRLKGSRQKNERLGEQNEELLRPMRAKGQS